MLNDRLLLDYLKVAKEAALAGGAILKSYWGKLTEYEEKSIQGDLVTEADKQSEVKVLEVLQTAFPDHAIIAEESGYKSLKKSDFLWAVDPLDGTTNYAHHYPMFCVSIGLLYQGVPIIGVIYNPISDELFMAAKGKGAFLNEKPLKVSAVSVMRRSLLGTGFAYDREEISDNNYPEFCKLTTITHGVRRAGAAALDLAYVAAGRLDGFWELGLKIWDIAAGILLVEEAGGKVSSYDLSPVNLESGRILASNGHLHEMISGALMEVRLQTRERKNQGEA